VDPDPTFGNGGAAVVSILLTAANGRLLLAPFCHSLKPEAKENVAAAGVKIDEDKLQELGHATRASLQLSGKNCSLNHGSSA
jgi:hypothetical protein